MKKLKGSRLLFKLIVGLALCIAVAACAQPEKPRLFQEGILEVINFGDSLILSEYIEDFDDKEMSLTISKGEYSKDLSDESSWEAPEPGEYVLTYEVKLGNKKYSESINITVKIPKASWSFTKQDFLYQYEETVNFEDLFEAFNINVKSYYDYKLVVKDVTIGTEKKEIASDVTSYKLLSIDEHKFTIGFETDDGQEDWTQVLVYVRYADTATEQWLKDNNVELHGEIAVKSDRTIKLLGGTATGSGRLFQTSDVPYVAFKGNYGAGSFVQFEFKGKNLPQVSFFNEEITSNLFDGKKGIFVSNGATTTSGRAYSALDNARLTVYGTNKIMFKEYDDKGRFPVLGSIENPAAISISQLNESTNYKYIIGFTDATTGSEGTVKLNILLINMDTGEEVFRYDPTLSVKQIVAPANQTLTFASDYFSGSIVAYGRLGRTTEFKVTHLPHTGITDINTLDKKSEFKNAYKVAGIGEVLKVSDYIDTSIAEDYELYYEDEDGVAVPIEGNTFSFDKAGDYRLYYKINDGQSRKNTIVLKVSAAYDGTKLAWMKENNISLNRATQVTADGRVVLSATNYDGVNTQFPYVAYNGNYGSGTFIETDFVGKGMPIVAFFADKVTDSITDKNQGILLTNGFRDSLGRYLHGTSKHYTLFGPKKVETGGFAHNGRKYIAQNSEMAIENLEENTNYRLIIGFTDGQEGTGENAKVKVHVMLFNLDTNTEMEKNVVDIKLSDLTDDEEYTRASKTFGPGYFGGSIVLYGATYHETTVTLKLPRAASSIDEIDVKAGFKADTVDKVLVEQPLNVADYIVPAETGATYKLSYKDSKGVITEISDNTFSFSAVGEYKLIYTVTKHGSSKTVSKTITVGAGAILRLSTLDDKLIYDTKARKIVFADFLEEIEYTMYPSAASDVAIKVLSITELQEDGGTTTSNVANLTEYSFTKVGRYLIEVGGVYNDIPFSSELRVLVKDELNADTMNWMGDNNIEAVGQSAIRADNNIEFDKVSLDNSNGKFPYVAYKGDFQENTFVAFDFQGKAMPNITFFAKEVTNDLWDGKAGLMFSNGFADGYGQATVQNLTAFLPNKASTKAYNSGADRTYVVTGDVGAQVLDAGKNYRVIIGVTDGSTKGFTIHLTLIDLTDNTVIREAVEAKAWASDLFPEGYFNGGSIVLYGSTYAPVKISMELPAPNLKAVVKTTAPDMINKGVEAEVSSFIETLPSGYTAQLSYRKVGTETLIEVTGDKFTINDAANYTLVYKVKFNNKIIRYITKPLTIKDIDATAAAQLATDNVTYWNASKLTSDGVITLPASKLNNQFQLDNMPYVAYNGPTGGYGNGTFVEIDFKGKQLPQVVFFADEVTNSLTDGKRGILLSNGFAGNDGANFTDKPTRLWLFGPNKVDSTQGLAGGSGLGRTAVVQDSKIGMSNLEAEKQYKVVYGITDATVGRHLAGSVKVHIMIIEVATNTVLEKNSYTVSISKLWYNYINNNESEGLDPRCEFGSDYFGGSIVLYSPTYYGTEFKVKLPVTDATITSMDDYLAKYINTPTGE